MFCFSKCMQKFICLLTVGTSNIELMTFTCLNAVMTFTSLGQIGKGLIYNMYIPYLACVLNSMTTLCWIKQGVWLSC